VLLMAPFLAQADATIANVATPAIQASLGASGPAAQLVIGGYLVAFAALLSTGARLGQTHGYKRSFQLGIVVFGLSSAGGGLAPNATALIIMRVIQGAGAALMFPQALTSIQLTFAGDKRARAISVYALAAAGGAVIGQILGGVLVWADIAGTGWRPILLINVPICAAVLIAAARYLPPDQQRHGGRLDLPGIGALSLALLVVVVPLTLGGGQGWPAWTWLCLAAGAPAFWWFLVTQRRAAATRRDPLINTAVLARPTIIFGLITLLVGSGTYYALLFTLAQYVQSGLGRSALACGLITVPWVTAFGLAGHITRSLPARLHPILPVAGYLLLALTYLAIGATVIIAAPSDILLAVLLALGGLGLGTGFTTLIGHLTNSVPARYAPDISGVVTTILQIGGALGVAALGGLYLWLRAPSGAAAAGPTFAVTSLALAAAALLAAATAYLTTHTHPNPRQTNQPRCCR
jgi:MFS family permease